VFDKDDQEEIYDWFKKYMESVHDGKMPAFVAEISSEVSYLLHPSNHNNNYITIIKDNPSQ